MSRTGKNGENNKVHDACLFKTGVHSRLLFHTVHFIQKYQCSEMAEMLAISVVS